MSHTVPKIRLTQDGPEGIVVTVEHPTSLDCPIYLPRVHYQQTLLHAGYAGFYRLGNNVELAQLRSQVNELEDEISLMRDYLPTVVYVEEVSFSEAKEKVVKYFEENSEADLEELLIALKIPARTLFDVVDELRKDGRLAPVGEE